MSTNRNLIAVAVVTSFATAVVVVLLVRGVTPVDVERQVDASDEKTAPRPASDDLPSPVFQTSTSREAATEEPERSLVSRVEPYDEADASSRGVKEPIHVKGMGLPEPRGSAFWLSRYHQFGDLTTGEYERLAISHRRTYSQLTRSYARDMLVSGDYFPWSKDVELETDKQLRSLLSGDQPHLFVGGAKEPYGEYYVVFTKEAHPDVYDFYWDYLWLSSAAEGEALHLPN